MTTSILARALAATTDAALVLALVETSRLLLNVPSTRSVSFWSTALFASMGVAIVCFFCVALIVCALNVPSSIHRLLRWALVLGTVVALYAGQSLAFALLLLAARCVGASAAGAGFTRTLAAAFSVVFAVASLASRHVLRAHLSHDTLLIGHPMRWLAERFPAPALLPLAEREVAPGAPTTHTHRLVLVIELRALAPEVAMSMASAQLVARHGALFIDARRATEGRSVLSAWNARFAGWSETRYVRCDQPRSIEPCALAALLSHDPLVLWLRTDERNPAVLDRQIATVLRAAHAHTPLSSAVVALTSERAPSNSWLDDANTRALVLLSARGIAPGVVRGAIRVDELAAAIDALGSSADHPVLALAQRRMPWFDRMVVLTATRGSVTVRSVHSARASLVVAPTRWGVALFDHELDPHEQVNRADLLRSTLHSMGARMGAVL